MSGASAESPLRGEFNLNDVLVIRGHHFKIVLVDGYTGKIAMKWITAEEAALIEQSRAGSPAAMPRA